MCTKGEEFFLSNATPGDNLYLCTATDTWTPIKGSAMLAPGNATDCQLTRYSASTLKMASCRVRVGTKNWSFPDTDFILSPLAPSDTVYFYLLNGALIAGYNSTQMILSGTGFVQANGISGVPEEAAPIGSWAATVTPGQWNETGTDLRAAVEASIIDPGTGIVATDNPTTGVRSLSLDKGTVPTYSYGAAAPPALCSVGEIYIRTDTRTVYHCTSENVWTTSSGGAAYIFTGPLQESGGTVGCPECVSTGGEYANPSWLSSLDWSKLASVPTAFTPAPHSHSSNDLEAASKQGNGSKVQMFGGGTVNPDDCAKFDAAGNIVSAGSVCSSPASGAGTVTSVGLAMPADFQVINSPVTGDGTITVTRANQNANQILAGPVSGSAAVPSFRALAVTDLPSLASSNLTDSAGLVKGAAALTHTGVLPVIDTGGTLKESAYHDDGTIAWVESDKLKIGSTVLSATANVMVPVTVSTASPVTVTGGFYFNDAAGALTFNLPNITSDLTGAKFCFRNAAGRSGAITLQAPASTYIDKDGANGTAGGAIVSAGAAGDSACVLAISTTQYIFFGGSGTWTNN